jgi:acyl-CoA thioester hydrolase
VSGEDAAGAPAGRLDGRRHLLPVRVYWEDTDAGGIVYHTSYLRFLERGRTELLRALGIAQAAMLAETGVAFAVRRLDATFHGAARLDDVLVVATEPALLRGASIVLGQTIRRSEDLLIEAAVTCVCVKAGRAVRLPPAVRETMARLAG